MNKRGSWKVDNVKKGCLKFLNKNFRFRKDNGDSFIHNIENIDIYPDLIESPISEILVNYDKNTPKTSSNISSVSPLTVKYVSPSEFRSFKQINHPTPSSRCRKKNQFYDDHNWINDNTPKQLLKKISTTPVIEENIIPLRNIGYKFAKQFGKHGFWARTVV